MYLSSKSSSCCCCPAPLAPLTSDCLPRGAPSCSFSDGPRRPPRRRSLRGRLPPAAYRGSCCFCWDQSRCSGWLPMMASTAPTSAGLLTSGRSFSQPSSYCELPSCTPSSLLLPPPPPPLSSAAVLPSPLPAAVGCSCCRRGCTGDVAGLHNSGEPCVKQLWAGGEPRNAGPSPCSRGRSGSSDAVGVITAAMPLQGADIAADACGLLLQSGSMHDTATAHRLIMFV